MEKKAIYPRITLAIDDLVDDINDYLDRDDIIAFIKSIDEKVADWDFTIELYKYFQDQKDLFDAEERLV